LRDESGSLVQERAQVILDLTKDLWGREGSVRVKVTCQRTATAYTTLVEEIPEHGGSPLRAVFATKRKPNEGNEQVQPTADDSECTEQANLYQG
jgi:hypothetical protein